MPAPMNKHDAPRTIRHSSRSLRRRDADDDEKLPELTNDPFEDAFALDDEGAADRRRDPLRH